MHYRESKWMHLGNAALEYLLTILVYLASGAIRVVIPIGKVFFIEDVWRLFPLGIVYATVLVVCYYLEGSYATIHIRGTARELALLCVTNMFAFTFTAMMIFVFGLSQFSRLWLGLFYLLSVAVFFVKRLAFEKIANWYVKKNQIQEKVLLIGAGPLALRFYNGVLKQYEHRMIYAGCLAEPGETALPDCLGTPDDLHSVLEQQKIDVIVLAQEEQSADWIRRLVAIAAGYRIRVCLVPVYTDYVTSRSEMSYLGGLRLLDLSLLDSCDIMGVHVAVTDMNKTLSLVESQLEAWRGKYICVSNVHTTVTASEDESYKAVQNNAVMALPDGGPLSAFSREHGYADAARVTGPDLMREVLKISAQKGWRHYFYGSTEETLALLRKKLDERYPGVQVAGMYSPPFRPLTPAEDAGIVERINAARPDFVWVGLGAPKQERWMAAHEDRVQALMIGVGAAFDYEAGNIKRAPGWMQRHSLEWLYRLLQDPKRLFSRYMSTNLKFLLWKWKQ